MAAKGKSVSKNQRSKTVIEDKKTLLPMRFYAAGASYWIGSTEETIELAQADISRRLPGVKNIEVKVY